MVSNIYFQKPRSSAERNVLPSFIILFLNATPILFTINQVAVSAISKPCYLFPENFKKSPFLAEL